MRFPRWTPCLEDPEEFDCRRCEIDDPVSCQRLVDESLRSFEAVRWRNRNHPGSLPVRQAGAHWPLADELETVIRRRGISVSARAAHRDLSRRLASDYDEDAVAGVLALDARFFETSPGLYRVRPDEEVDRGPVLQEPRASAGTFMAYLLGAAEPVDPAKQVRAFKRLAALRTATRLVDRRLSLAHLNAQVEHLAPVVQRREGWTLSDLHDAAASSRQVPFQDHSEEARNDRYEVLSALGALELLTRSDMGSLRSALDAVDLELTLGNLRLVGHMATRYSYGTFLRVAELVQEGTIGLITAMGKFDPYLGFTFSTYATPWVRQAITRAIADQDRTVRLPVHLVEKIARVRRAERNLEAAGGDTPSAASIAGLAGNGEEPISPDEVRRLLDLDRPPLSLGSKAVRARLRPSIDPAEISETRSSEQRQQLANILDLLPKKVREVVKLRVGWDGGLETLELIGQRYGVTRERIRQIEAKGLGVFRRAWVRDVLVQYLNGTVGIEEVARVIRRQTPPAALPTPRRRGRKSA